MKTILYYKSEHDQIFLHSLATTYVVTKLAISYDGSIPDILYKIISDVLTDEEIKDIVSTWEGQYPGTWLTYADAETLGQQLQPDRDIEGISFHFSLDQTEYDNTKDLIKNTPEIIKKLALVLLDEINLIRTELSLTTRTQSQLVNAIKNKEV